MIELQKNNNVAELVINRPEKMNAITPQMAKQIKAACDDINHDKNIHAVLFYGAGDKAFCAGSDLNTLNEYESLWAWRNRVEYVTEIRNLRKPVVCAVKGWVLGGGHELAVAADIRIASENAIFGSSEVKLGWVGAGGTSQMLPRLVGYGQAMKILLTGERIDAKEALRIGLVEEVVGVGKEVERGRELVAIIASNPPIATETTKSAVRAGMNGNMEMGLQIENELMTLCFAMGEGESGVEKFNNRKKE